MVSSWGIVKASAVAVTIVIATGAVRAQKTSEASSTSVPSTRSIAAAEAARVASLVPQKSGPTVDHVIVISVDGLGYRLLQSSPAPTLKGLIRDTRSATQARTIDPPLTVPSHVSMLSGIDPQRHHLLHNHYDDSLTRIDAPTIFDLTKRNGLTSAAVFGKSKLRYVFEQTGVDRMHAPEWKLGGDAAGRFPSLIETAAIQEIRERKPSLLFVHYALPDTMGHWMKWGSFTQKVAVKLVDESIRRIIDQASRNYPAGRFAILITADHGGHGGGHGATNEEGHYVSPETDLMIPFILVGATLKPEIEKVHVYDTAATIAGLLGLKVPSEWNWQGQSVAQ